MNANPLIFIVDDDDFIHKLIQSILGKFSYDNINHYYSGEECIDCLHKSPDIILLDIEMKGINGLETLDMIKTNNPQIPVYIISSQTEINTAISAFKIGAEDFFSKDSDLPKKLEKIFSSSKPSD